MGLRVQGFGGLGVQEVGLERFLRLQGDMNTKRLFGSKAILGQHGSPWHPKP